MSALATLKKALAKMGIKNKRFAAGWDNTSLELVLRDFLTLLALRESGSQDCTTESMENAVI